MDSEHLASLIEQAESRHWAERCQAGVLLAKFAEDDTTHPTLLRLLQDAENTAVPADTALALLRRHDLHGLRLFALAFAGEVQDAHDELVALLFKDEAYGWWPLHPALKGLTGDEDPEVRKAAYEVLNALAGGRG